MSRLAGLVVLALAAGAARADVADATRGWRFGAEAETAFPLDFGVRATAEDPHRVRLALALGALPGPYVDTINQAIVAVGGYDQAQAELIRAALRSSVVAQARLGWRPSAAHGGYFDFGYTLIALGGSATESQLITAATGMPPPADAGAAGHGYDVASTLHLIGGELGWEWRIGSGLTVRAAIGFDGTAAAHTSIAPDFTPKDPAAQARYAKTAATALDHLYTTYVFTPTAAIAMGWQL